VAAGQDRVATPEVLLDVLEDSPDTVGWPGAPGAVTPVPPLPGICTTVSVYGATVTDEVEVCVALVIEVALLPSVYTVG
jgi:hypothetical protein